MTAQDKRQQALLPCPFCGSEANVFCHGEHDAYVVCSQCNGRNSVSAPDENGAIKAWNHRALAPPPKSVEETEAVEAMHYIGHYLGVVCHEDRDRAVLNDKVRIVSAALLAR